MAVLSNKLWIVTALSKRPRGIYILTGFTKKTLTGRQLFHRDAHFYRVAVLRFSNTQKNDICWLGKAVPGKP